MKARFKKMRDALYSMDESTSLWEIRKWLLGDLLQVMMPTLEQCQWSDIVEKVTEFCAKQEEGTCSPGLILTNIAVWFSRVGSCRCSVER